MSIIYMKPSTIACSIDKSGPNKWWQLRKRSSPLQRSITDSPHDKFFRFAFKHIDLVRALTQMTFPANLLNQLDLNAIRLESGTWIDSKLREKRADLLFSLPILRTNEDPKTAARTALLYLLLEHKSTADHYTVLQVLSYLLQIWEDQKRKNTHLTPIFALVIFHGSTRWNAPTTFRELLPMEFDAKDLQLDFKITIFDLTTWTANQWDPSPILTSTLQLLKYSRSPDLSDLLFGILDRIRASAIRHTLEEWFQACWNYAMTTNPYMTNTRIQEIVDELLSVEFEPGSAADQLYRQGHQEGLADGAEIGIIIGRIQLLQQLLGLEVSPSNELLQLDIPQINLIATSLEQRLNEK